ncbi:MAG: hypothetical protein KC505_06940 [Myxococcales bacterium]|nr:hypothetical protein [Myxococcales bacterium]USN50495.1 MAG: hypothetical protein H6731_09570 [Myxococcales bacterium]
MKKLLLLSSALFCFFVQAHGHYLNSRWEIKNESSFGDAGISCWAYEQNQEDRLFSYKLASNQEKVRYLDYSYADGMGYPSPDTRLYCQVKYNSKEAELNFRSINYGSHVIIILKDNQFSAKVTDSWNPENQQEYKVDLR